jgi:hypothetical protein
MTATISKARRLRPMPAMTAQARRPMIVLHLPKTGSLTRTDPKSAGRWALPAAPLLILLL